MEAGVAYNRKSVKNWAATAGQFRILEEMAQRQAVLADRTVIFCRSVNH